MSKEALSTNCSRHRLIFYFISEKKAKIFEKILSSKLAQEIIAKFNKKITKWDLQMTFWMEDYRKGD